MVPLTEGEVAPFAGQLLSPDVAIDLALKADTCDRRLELETHYQEDKTAARISFLNELREIEQASAKAREAAILKAAQRRWFEHPYFVSAVTFVGTLGVVWIAGQVP